MSNRRKLRPVRESRTAVAGPRRTSIAESPTMIGEAEGRPGHVLVQLIRAGWSLNNTYYSAEVLRRDGPKAWPAGTLNYVDHASDADEESHPAGSLMRLASYQTTAASWDEERQALVAEVRPFAPWREAVIDWAASGAIGMSIRAWVYGEDGEAEGRKGFVVSSIPEGRSCDYVTVPAAGGALLAVLESVRRRSSSEARNVGAWLESRLHLALTQLGDDMYGDGRLTREERIVLSTAIGEALQVWTARVQADAGQLFERDLWSYPEPAASAEEHARRTVEAATEETRAALSRIVQSTYSDGDRYAWVRDFDPDGRVVWFDVSGGDDESGTWEQGYELGDGGAASLIGDRVEVVARTVYQPVPSTESAPGVAPDLAAVAVTENVPDGAPPTAPNPPNEEEPAMSGTQTGAPPAQAGTAPVVDTPAPVTPAQPEQPRTDPAVTSALESITAQLAAMQDRLAAETARADAREADTRRLRNEHTAREQVTAALAASEHADVRDAIGPRVTAVVLRDVPTGDGGDVDTVRLGEAITAAITSEAAYVTTIRAQEAERNGYGMPRGLGGQPVGDDKDDEFETELAGFFAGSLGMTEAAAQVAAKGRG